MSSNPTVIRRCNGTRTTIRHRGIRGQDGLPGDPGEVQSATNVSADTELAVFSGTGGETIKRSNILLAAIALLTDLNGKVDVDGDKVLSEEDFTTVLKAKLDALSSGTFRGTYDDEAQLNASVPIGNAGDYAYTINIVPDPLAEQQEWIWDAINGKWTSVALGSTPRTATEILAELLTDPDFNVLTDVRLDMLNNAVQQSTLDAILVTIGGGSVPTSLATVVTEGTLARQLTLNDVGTYIRLTNAAPCDITLDTDADAVWVMFPEIFFRITTVPPTFTLGVGVTLNGEANIAGLSADQNFSIKRVGVNTWDAITN